MASVMQEAIAQQRMAQVVLTMFAAVALLLASIGLYGLVAHSVTERTQEIGVRMAMGAQAHDVLRLMVANGLSMTAVGAVAGVIGAALLAGSLESLLYGVKPIDPLTFVSVVALLLVTSLVACLIPAARGTRIAPTIALRSE
jgi:ABC-type antimicrobial peptide transport system permease subunit